MKRKIVSNTPEKIDSDNIDSFKKNKSPLLTNNNNTISKLSVEEQRQKAIEWANEKLLLNTTSSTISSTKDIKSGNIDTKKYTNINKSCFNNQEENMLINNNHSKTIKTSKEKKTAYNDTNKEFNHYNENDLILSPNNKVTNKKKNSILQSNSLNIINNKLITSNNNTTNNTTTDNNNTTMHSNKESLQSLAQDEIVKDTSTNDVLYLLPIIKSKKSITLSSMIYILLKYIILIYVLFRLFYKTYYIKSIQPLFHKLFSMILSSELSNIVSNYIIIDILLTSLLIYSLVVLIDMSMIIILLLCIIEIYFNSTIVIEDATNIINVFNKYIN